MLPPPPCSQTPLIATRPKFPSLTSLSLHPGIPVPFSHDSPPAMALKGARMLGAPPLSRTPTDVSQRSFGGVLRRGVGTPTQPAACGARTGALASTTCKEKRTRSEMWRRGATATSRFRANPLAVGSATWRRGLTMRSTGWRLGRAA